MALDLNDLIPRARRKGGDILTESVIEETDALENSTDTIVLEEDGYATVNLFRINGSDIPDTNYTVTKNVIKNNSTIAQGSSVYVDYDYTTYSDQQVLDFLQDGALIIQAIVHKDWGFQNGYVSTSDVAYDYATLITVAGAFGMNQLEQLISGGDAIYIRDGDTVIDTATANREKARSMSALVNEWNYLVNKVLTNNFCGVSMY